MTSEKPAPPSKAPLIDSPEISEVFADDIATFWLRDTLFRFTCAVHRMKNEDPNDLVRTTVSRFVLTLPAAVELHACLDEALTQLVQRGVIKRAAGRGTMTVQ